MANPRTLDRPSRQQFGAVKAEARGRGTRVGNCDCSIAESKCGQWRPGRRSQVGGVLDAIFGGSSPIEVQPVAVAEAQSWRIGDVDGLHDDFLSHGDLYGDVARLEEARHQFEFQRIPTATDQSE